MQKTIDHFLDRDFHEVYKFIKKNYLIFLISGFVFFASAFIYNQISIPEYKITAQVLIKSDNTSERGGISNVLSLNLLGDNTNFNNELLKIKTIPFIEKVIQNLDLETTYYSKGVFKYADLYTESPVKVIFVSDHMRIIIIRILNRLCIFR